MTCKEEGGKGDREERGGGAAVGGGMAEGETRGRGGEMMRG